MNEKSIRVLEFNKIKDELKNYTVSAAGKDIIADLMPYSDIYQVKEHLQETHEAVRLMAVKGSPPFEGVYDTRSAIERAGKGSVLMPGQLYKIANVMKAARRFKDYIATKEDEEAYRIIQDICEGVNPLKGLEDEIFNAVAGEEELADKASSALYTIRRQLKDKNLSVRDKVNNLVRSYSQYLQDNLYTMRGERYVLPVRAEHKGNVPGIIHDQSSSGATLYIEPMSLVTLNNEIRELVLKEKAEVERILAELSGKVRDEIISVKNNGNIIWELDFIFAKAKYAMDKNCVCPNINSEGYIDIIEGRHPLIPRNMVVPSSVYLGRDFTTLVITGPNTGGKTVTLKTVGLLQVMALSGLMIPARENSTVSFFKEIYADIGDEQSIEQSLSTFSSHMKNIVHIIENADKDSLILFDELGAGTDPTEGAALAVSILENLKLRSSRIIATTHYSELKAYALKTKAVENASVEFDVETLKPTYRLLIGIPGKSNAFEISKRLGLPEYIISGAKENITNETLKFEDLIQSLQEKSIKAQDDARAAEAIKLQAQKLQDKYNEKLYNLQNAREKAIIDAQREAKAVIKEAKEEADSILKNMREMERLGYSSEARKKLEEERKKIKDRLEKAEDAINAKKEDQGEKLAKISIGMDAFIPSLNQKVIVLSNPDSKGEVQVQAGIMKISVKASDLRASKESKEKSKKSTRTLNLNMKAVATSIDLRGMDSEEAIFNTDKYLDEAYMAGLNEVTIIHGKGTGVLRNSINDMLKRHPHVEKYRLGEYGEGGTGVTVAVLK